MSCKCLQEWTFHRLQCRVALTVLHSSNLWEREGGRRRKKGREFAIANTLVTEMLANNLIRGSVKHSSTTNYLSSVCVNYRHMYLCTFAQCVT